MLPQPQTEEQQLKGENVLFKKKLLFFAIYSI